MAAGTQPPPKSRRPVIIVVLLVVAVVLYFATHRSTQRPGILEGSGTIEATQVDLAPKVSGRVTVLHVKEGQVVKKNDKLAELDGVELQEQLDEARANLQGARERVSSARSQLALERDQYDAGLDQARATRETSVSKVPQAGENLKLQKGTVSTQIQQVQGSLLSAQASLAAAHGNAKATRQTWLAAIANVQTAQANADKTKDDDVRYTKLFKEDAVSAEQQESSHTAYQAAVGQLIASQAQVKAAHDQHDAAVEQEKAAKGAVEQAEAALSQALVNTRTIQVRALDVVGTQAQLGQADAGVRVAEANHARIGQRQHDLDAALDAEKGSEAALSLAQTNRDNATLVAPFDGTILSKNVEVGDLVAIGSPMITIADIGNPYMRVYVNETEFARVKLGQKAELVVDSFPNKTFTGYVDEMRDKAEYIPGNVQTKDERAKLVFGVRLRLDNSEGFLKPGLPADASIHAP